MMQYDKASHVTFITSMFGTKHVVTTMIIMVRPNPISITLANRGDRGITDEACTA